MKKYHGTGIGIGRNLIRLDNVDSTNSYALRLIKQRPPPEGTVILADCQSSGRGQAGNAWQGAAGKNLTFSIVLYPETLAANRQFFLSMAVSSGIAACLDESAIVAKVKWPNDICIHEKKIAGILIENALLKDNILHSVIGIGLNVNQDHFPEDIGPVTSMCLEGGMEYKKDEILQSLLMHISERLHQVAAGQYGKLKSDYMDRLQHLGIWRCFDSDSGRFEGKIVDVAESGELVIMRRSGEVSFFAFKEIKPCR